MTAHYSTRFQQFTFSEPESCLCIEWQPQTATMTEEQYKQEQLQTLEFVLKYQPKNLLINSRQLQFIITPDLQDWTNAHLVNPCIEAGVEKFAFVMPEGIIAQVAIHQAIDDNPVQKSRTAFFSDKEQAFQWLQAS